MKAMGLVIVDERCEGCGACEAACAFGGIKIEDGIARFTPECTACGACIEACPVDAIINEDASRQASKPGGLDSFTGAWVITDHDGSTLDEVSLQLVSVARDLARARGSTVTAVILGWDGSMDALETLGHHGASTVIVVRSEALQVYRTEHHVNILERLVRERRPEIMLVPATPKGRDYAPRLSKRLGTGLTADCTGLAIEEGTGLLLQTRPTFGGNIMATIKTPGTRPQMATVRPGVFKAVACEGEPPAIEVIDDASCPDDFMARIVKVLRVERQAANLADARVIVAGGRGIGSGEKFELVEDLARAVGGEVAGTRMACELGWVTKERQVGQTGKTVAPDVYIACGISGAIQHKVGMQGASTIIAINKDPDAPIFDVAHYGIVGDVNEIIPAIVSAMAAGKEKNDECSP